VNPQAAQQPPFARAVCEYLIVVYAPDGVVERWVCLNGVHELVPFAAEMVSKGYVPHRPSEQEKQLLGNCDFVYERDMELSTFQRV
jgi:hypothetical protein